MGIPARRMKHLYRFPARIGGRFKDPGSSGLALTNTYEADNAARRLGGVHNHRWTAFGPVQRSAAPGQ